MFVADGMSLHVHEIPEIGSIYPSLRLVDGKSVEISDWLPYPTCDRPQDNDVALYLHSAGSTGLPKPIPITQRVLTQYMTHRTFDATHSNNIQN